jgi:hypothetical protein
VVRQDKSRSRVTPKKDPAESSGVSREPVKVGGPLSTLMPILMFGCMGLGLIIILLNYLADGFLGMPSNWYLLTGLGLILVGIVAATRYE